MALLELIKIIIPLVIGGLITYYYTKRAKLEVEELNTILLKTGIEDFGIKLLLDNEQYDKPLVVYDIQIINRGNRDISYHDVERNIKLLPPDGLRIIKSVSSKENNPDIGTVEKEKDSSIVFNLKSIKKNEKIKFQVFAVFDAYQGKEDDFVAPKLKISGRIRNIDTINYYNKPPLRRINYFILLMSPFLAIAFYLLVLFVEPLKSFLESIVKIESLFRFIPIVGALLIMGIPILINMLIRKIFP